MHYALRRVDLVTFFVSCNFLLETIMCCILMAWLKFALLKGKIGNFKFMMMHMICTNKAALN